LAITALGLLAAASAAWSAKSLRDRGYLRSWIRNRLAAQALAGQLQSIEVTWAHYLSSLPGDEVLKRSTFEKLQAAADAARQITLDETKVWALNASDDLGEYVKSALKISETLQEAREQTTTS
jgi:hypothetical protein